MSKIRIKHFEHEVEIEGDEEFIKSQIESFYIKIGDGLFKSTNLQTKEKLAIHTQSSFSGKKPTPAEFYKSKNKTDGLSQILIFAKYLETYEESETFTREDINRLAKDAKLSKDIHSQYFTNAVKEGLLRNDKGKYSLTLSAESILSSM